MLTILVINSKGGAGKTTLTTNLASYFASGDSRTAIMDCDPQGSSLHWVSIRPERAPKIHGVNAAPQKGGMAMRSLHGWVPPDIEVLIIDAPAGVKGLQLQELVRRSNYIIIPVAPSPIDIHATADFIKELYLAGGARTSKARIAVVANRVRNASSPVYAKLERFLNSLKLPFLTTLRDSDVYLQAVERGLGVFELDAEASAAERRELTPVVRWLDGQFLNRFGTRAGDRTLTLEESKRFSGLQTGTYKMPAFSSSGRFSAVLPDNVPAFLKRS